METLVRQTAIVKCVECDTIHLTQLPASLWEDEPWVECCGERTLFVEPLCLGAGWVPSPVSEEPAPRPTDPTATAEKKAVTVKRRGFCGCAMFYSAQAVLIFGHLIPMLLLR